MLFKILALLAYLGVIVVNFLANALPINGLSTGEVSDFYPNLFTPAGLTFSIWGLIYLLLALYILYQFGLFRKEKDESKEGFLKRLNIYFIVTSLANMAWIYAWHHTLVGLSLLVMVVLLVCLIKISDLLNKQDLSSRERLLVCLPFTVYFGWITVATIANVTAFLVSLNWGGFGVSEQVWTILVLVVGTIIGILRMMKDRRAAYGLVFIWAYLGILIKHLSSVGFAGEYVGIIATVALCLLALAVSVTLVGLKKGSGLKSLKS